MSFDSQNRRNTKWFGSVAWAIGFGLLFLAGETSHGFAQDARNQDRSSDRISFAADIQPIFAEHCLECHGPDQAESGLRLDLKQHALSEGDSGYPAIVPGDAADSEVMLRIATDDEYSRMPPEGDPLSEEQIDKIRTWIDHGATFDRHWAYRPIADEAPPQVDSDWIRNPIDAYVLDRLNRELIRPSPEASRAKLIKRLYYDLIGLPPTPAEVDAFIEDRSEDAYEKLVDRLLASKHFGERWGRHWLDKARYADSDGYEKDNHRPDAWRYRDWVINAINDDMPFDQFTIEQLAGDLLPNATKLQHLATAFHRQTLTNTEGGTDPEQWRVAAVMDRTETLGTVWLGLTFNCARCHDHKYDQLSQEEYYQMFAFFNNGDEVSTRLPKSFERDAQLTAQIDKLKSQIETRKAELRTEITEWLPPLRREVESWADQPVQYHSLKKIEVQGPDGVEFTRQEDGSYLVSGDNPEVAQYTVVATVNVDGVTGIRLEVLPDPSLPSNGPGRASHANFVLNEIQVSAAGQRDWSDKDRVRFESASADFSQDDWPVREAIDGVEGKGRDGTGWAISPKMGEDHAATFAFEKTLPGDRPHLQIVLKQTYGGQHTIGRFRLTATTGRIPGSHMPDDVFEIVRKISTDPAQLDEASVKKLVTFQQTRDPKSKQLAAELQKTTDAREANRMSVRVIGQRKTDPRETHVFRRGEFQQPLEPVSTGTPSFLPEIQSEKEKPTRLDLARWLVGGQNPLVPRVAVNHVWKHLFGEGLVTTMNDFGVRGAPPSHPALMDHLAQKLMEQGWSRKALIKSIVMSSTYRQSSQHRPELREIDPLNRLLYRQNRFRVEAEIVRDLALSVSGLLSPKIGGPSVFPPIPESVTDLTYNSSFQWKTSEGEDRYRRGMYTYFKRTAPHPNLITFDCPDSNVTNVERKTSNTPIAALVTLNNEVYVEAAQAMAARVLEHSELTDDQARLAFALRLCIARHPEEVEVVEFRKLLDTSRQWYREHTEAAQQLVGDRPVEGVAAEENAAWIATLRIMLNLDEFLTRE